MKLLAVDEDSAVLGSAYIGRRLTPGARGGICAGRPAAITMNAALPPICNAYAMM